MRISVKTRYGLSALICLAREYEHSGQSTVLSLSKKLGISKIYLEQVFGQLKKAELVISFKGSQGGYRLARHPSEINVHDIFVAIEAAVTEKTKDTILKQEENIEIVLRDLVYSPLEEAIYAALSAVTLEDLVSKIRDIEPSGYMYYL